ncbi:unnamed protein product [Notodromas monacha]|uniref:Peptidase S1 domain-containing protein n=1 Tax=Notodromas monacha TaxID=399045 RepID=A0A7R9BGR3_9CRUS|nr:unnamed protein product [Notodromas monacha]CAG0913570.1 unnamed protein product [Notodromas monacha]
MHPPAEVVSKAFVKNCKGHGKDVDPSEVVYVQPVKIKPVGDQIPAIIAGKGGLQLPISYPPPPAPYYPPVHHFHDHHHHKKKKRKKLYGYGSSSSNYGAPLHLGSSSSSGAGPSGYHYGAPAAHLGSSSSGGSSYGSVPISSGAGIPYARDDSNTYYDSLESLGADGGARVLGGGGGSHQLLQTQLAFSGLSTGAGFGTSSQSQGYHQTNLESHPGGNKRGPRRQFNTPNSQRSPFVNPQVAQVQAQVSQTQYAQQQQYTQQQNPFAVHQQPQYNAPQASFNHPVYSPASGKSIDDQCLCVPASLCALQHTFAGAGSRDIYAGAADNNRPANYQQYNQLDPRNTHPQHPGEANKDASIRRTKRDAGQKKVLSNLTPAQPESKGGKGGGGGEGSSSERGESDIVPSFGVSLFTRPYNTQQNGRPLSILPQLALSVDVDEGETVFRPRLEFNVLPGFLPGHSEDFGINEVLDGRYGTHHSNTYNHVPHAAGPLYHQRPHFPPYAGRGAQYQHHHHTSRAQLGENGGFQGISIGRKAEGRSVSEDSQFSTSGKIIFPTSDDAKDQVSAHRTSRQETDGEPKMIRVGRKKRSLYGDTGLLLPPPSPHHHHHHHGRQKRSPQRYSDAVVVEDSDYRPAPSATRPVGGGGIQSEASVGGVGVSGGVSGGVPAVGNPGNPISSGTQSQPNRPFGFITEAIQSLIPGLGPGGGGGGGQGGGPSVENGGIGGGGGGGNRPFGFGKGKGQGGGGPIFNFKPLIIGQSVANPGGGGISSESGRPFGGGGLFGKKGNKGGGNNKGNGASSVGTEAGGSGEQSIAEKFEEKKKKKKKQKGEQGGGNRARYSDYIRPGIGVNLLLKPKYVPLDSHQGIDLLPQVGLGIEYGKGRFKYQPRAHLNVFPAGFFGPYPPHVNQPPPPPPPPLRPPPPGGPLLPIGPGGVPIPPPGATHHHHLHKYIPSGGLPIQYSAEASQTGGLPKESISPDTTAGAALQSNQVAPSSSLSSEQQSLQLNLSRLIALQSVLQHQEQQLLQQQQQQQQQLPSSTKVDTLALMQILQQNPQLFSSQNGLSNNVAPITPQQTSRFPYSSSSNQSIDIKTLLANLKASQQQGSRSRLSPAQEERIKGLPAYYFQSFYQPNDRAFSRRISTVPRTKRQSKASRIISSRDRSTQSFASSAFPQNQISEALGVPANTVPGLTASQLQLLHQLSSLSSSSSSSTAAGHDQQLSLLIGGGLSAGQTQLLQQLLASANHQHQALAGGNSVHSSSSISIERPSNPLVPLSPGVFSSLETPFEQTSKQGTFVGVIKGYFIPKRSQRNLEIQNYSPQQQSVVTVVRDDQQPGKSVVALEVGPELCQYVTCEKLEAQCGIYQLARVQSNRGERQLGNTNGICGAYEVCCRNTGINNNRPSSTNNGQCGVRYARGITGRVKTLTYADGDAEFGEYPWQAAILKKEGIDNVYICGGTLIDDQHIATAAHCIKGYSPSDLRVRLGEWDVNHDTEFYPHVELDVSAVVLHPEFYAGSLYNDIAILRLISYVDFSRNPHVSPVCLPSQYSELPAGYRCWTTGWGKDAWGKSGQYQNILKASTEVDVPLVEHRECENRLQNTRLGVSFNLHEGFLCAGGEAGKDACKGDGGGPLVCDIQGTWQLAGIVSWGIGCGEQDVPGVYAKVANYLPWIESVTRSTLG